MKFDFEVVKKGFYIVSGNGATAVSNIVIASLIISKFGLADYGLFVTLQAIYFVYEALSRPLTWQAIVKYYNGACHSSLIKLSLGIEFLAFLIVSGITVSVYFLLLNYADLNQYQFALFIAVVAAFFINNGTLVGVLRAGSLFSYVSFVQISCAIARCILVFAFLGNIVDLFAYILIIETLIWAAALCILYLNKNKLIEGKKINVIEFVKYSYWGTLHSALDLPVTQFDRLLIAKLAGLEVVGVYSILKRLALAVGQLAEPVSQISFQRFTGLVQLGDFDKIKRICCSISVLLTAGCAVILAAFFIGFDYLDSMLFAGKLESFKTLSILYMSIYVLGTIFVWLHPLSLALGLMAQNAKVLLLVNLIYIASLFFLVPDYSLAGVVIAFFLQVALSVAIKFLIIKRRI